MMLAVHNRFVGHGYARLLGKDKGSCARAKSSVIRVNLYKIRCPAVPAKLSKSLSPEDPFLDFLVFHLINSSH